MQRVAAGAFTFPPTRAFPTGSARPWQLRARDRRGVEAGRAMGATSSAEMEWSSAWRGPVCADGRLLAGLDASRQRRRTRPDRRCGGARQLTRSCIDSRHHQAQPECGGQPKRVSERGG